MSSVNDRIKEVRKNLKYNQTDFAEKLGISRTHISNIENGNDNASVLLLKLISLTFNVNEQWLYFGTGSMMPDIDVDTEEGLLAFYNEMRIKLENILKNRDNELYKSTVKSFAYFVGVIVNSEKLNKSNEYERMVQIIHDIFDIMERLLFKASSIHLYTTKKSSQTLIDFKESSEQQILKITTLLNEAVNLHLKYNDRL